MNHLTPPRDESVWLVERMSSVYRVWVIANYRAFHRQDLAEGWMAWRKKRRPFNVEYRVKRFRRV